MSTRRLLVLLVVMVFVISLVGSVAVQTAYADCEGAPCDDDDGSDDGGGIQPMGGAPPPPGDQGDGDGED